MTFSESTHFDQLEEFQKFSEKKISISIDIL